MAPLKLRYVPRFVNNSGITFEVLKLQQWVDLDSVDRKDYPETYNPSGWWEDVPTVWAAV